MGSNSSKIDESSKFLRGFDEENFEVFMCNPLGPRTVPKATYGEQVAAGWPAWLSAVAGEAIQGWVPRRAHTYEKLDKIGQGTYSNVYMARDLVHGKIVALKKVRFDSLEPESVRFVAREIIISRRLDHPNVIKLEGLITTRMSSSLYLVFEYMEHDLMGIASLPGIKFTEPQIKCYMHQLLSGLEYCHSQGVLHRDIKSSNLLIDNQGTLKIADFGLSTFFDSRQNLPLTSRIVTLWYRPPELLLGETHYGVAVDLWSTGCVLGELCAGRPIMPGKTEIEQLHKIFKLCGSPSDDYWRKSKLPSAKVFQPLEPYRRCLAETFRDLPPAALELMETLLSIYPEHRGTASSALECEFFTTEPFACDPSSLPKYPPSKEMNVKLHERSDSQPVLVAKGQRGEDDTKVPKTRQAFPPLHADGGLAGLMQHHRFNGKEIHYSGPSDNVAQMLVDHDSQIRDAVQRARHDKLSWSKYQVPGSQVTDNPLSSGPSRIQPNDGAQVPGDYHHHIMQETAPDVRPEIRRGRTKGRETASKVYSGPAIVPKYSVDQLLEEHDRHIQESAQKLRLEKRRGGKSKTQAQERHISTDPISSGSENVSVSKVDQLLEEHDRQIQESTQRLRLEKKRGGKLQAQGIQIRD